MEILTIGQKIRNRRKQLNMTLKELAGDRVTAGQLSFVELGKSNPSSELVQYIADKLQVTVDYLLESEMSQAQSICEYNIKLAQAYIYDDKNEDADAVLNKIVDIAVKYKLGSLIGKIEFNKGKIAFKRQEYQETIEHLLSANMFFLQDGDYTGAIDTYIQLGQVACISGYHNLALSYFKQAECMNKETGLYDEQLTARINYSICMCCIKLGHFEEADNYLPIVEKYFADISDEKQYAHGLMTISLNYRDAGDYEKALYYADKAMEIFKKIYDKEYVAKMQMNLGIIYCEKGDMEKSDFYLKNCEKINDSLGSDDRLSLFMKLACNYIKEKQFDEAVSYIEKCFKLAVENRNMDYQIECYKYLYNIYMNTKNYRESENILKNKLQLLESIDNVKELVSCYMDMSEYYNFIGDKQLAFEYMNKALNKIEDTRRKLEI